MYLSPRFVVDTHIGYVRSDFNVFFLITVYTIIDLHIDSARLERGLFSFD